MADSFRRGLALAISFCLISVAICELRYGYGYSDSATRLGDVVYTNGSSVIRVASSLNYVMQPYETAPLGGGLVYYKTPITTAHNGFVSAFTYLPSVCDSVNKGGPGGFSFFLTTDNITANWGVTSRPDEFALNSLNNVVMAGYSQTFNEFLLCSWNDAPRNYALRDVCPKLSNTSPKYACSTFDQSPTMVATYFFKVIYDKETLSIYVSDVLKFSQPLKLKPATYTIGFSANANSTYPFFRHQFTSWNFTTFETGVSNSFKYDARQVNDDRDKLQLIGQAALASDSIQMVPATDYVSGAIISTNAFAAHRGFRTRFTWTASQCADGPGDGFAFFLTPNYPVAKRITYSYGNTLGVSNLENVFAIGFSALRNELRACQWAQPRLDCQSADCITQSSALGSFKCNTTYNVEIQLFGQELKVYFNQKLVYSNLKAVGLTPGFYYAGITAANGDKIMRQDITDWSFELWNGYTQRFTSTNATLFQTFGNAFAYPSELLLTAGTLGGLVVTRQQTTVGTGFRTTFDFYTQFSLAYDGATFFLSKAYPSAQQLNDSSGVHGYGIRTLPRTMALVITLSDYMPGVLSMDHYICQWDTPLASSAFPQSCGSFYTALTQSRVTHRYNIQYNFNTLEVYVNETLRSAMPLSLDWDSYYVGFSGYGIGFNPYIRQWQFNASDDYTIDKKQFSNFTTSDILPNSNASVVPTQLQLTKPNYTSVGAAIHSNRLFAHLGFQSKFSYTATSCTNRNVSLTGLPQGFTFFLSPDVPSDDAVASSRDSGLGIFNVPNIALAVGYDNLKNVFNVCSWDTVDSQFECKSYPKAGAAFSCNTTYVYNLFYNHEILQVFVNYTRVLVHNLKLSVGLQYAGFSATNAADQFAQQSITSWIYASYQPPFGEQFNFASLGDVAFVTLGSADVVDSKLVLTNSSSQAGALFYPQQVRPDLGFNSSFVFLPINCDPIYNGADGFTLFFTKQYPVEENILASAGGQLGIQQQPDVSMFAYSRTFNEFFIANWTSPTTDLLRWFGQNIPNPQSKLACNGVYYFDLLYEHNTLSVYLNFNLVLTAPMNFDPTGYYVGLSGGTGQGYWSQEFRLWRFNSYEL